ncbi:MAG: glycosyltransferase family 9 protein [Rhodocyclaceae bacterium]|nr:glycosyltransferase family 9 protein [Rhodocyclaceae bacterium]
MSLNLGETPRLLIIRRDNIGDLLCTTPLIAALRERYPKAWIAALANSYNAPVLVGNPHLNAVYAYDKGKHLAGFGDKLHALARRLGLIRELRRQRIDVAILAAAGRQHSAERFARLCGARQVIGHEGLSAPEGLHEAEIVFRLAPCLGLHGEPPVMTLLPDAALAAKLAGQVPAVQGTIVGLHISARKPPQRWPAERYAELARRLHVEAGARFLLFWAPGSATDLKHPGDDEKAAALAARLAGLPAAPMPTRSLAELIAGLSLCDSVICSDGGAMHVAAALGKPLVCFFGNSDPVRWRPWGVPHQVLQAPSRDVADISVDQAFAAWQSL